MRIHRTSRAGLVGRVGVIGVVAGGCARPPARPVVLEATAPAVQVESCDVAVWHERASAALRGRIAGREVAVVDERGDRTRVIAELGRGLLVGAEVADGGFDRVVARETAIVATPGGAEVAGVFIAPGTAVDGAGAWAKVELHVPIEVAGYVPHAATALLWERGASGSNEHATELPASADVFATTDVAAQPIARIAGSYRVVDRVRDAGGGWLAIDAHDTSVRIAGFMQPPHRSPLLGTYDFSDDTIDGELVKPDAGPEIEWGCLFAKPDEHAPVVGVSDGGLHGTPAGNGWIEVRLAAPWGRIVGYGRASSDGRASSKR